MKLILQKLFSYQKLSQQEARELMLSLAEGKLKPAQMAALMTTYIMRPISVQELTGFREALLELCIAVDLGDMQTIDLCGTGGDGKNTFNISTLSSFVVAGAGYKVAKHGNYGVSSLCGSSNVLEALGYHFTNEPKVVQDQLEAVNISFLHAPLFHPALKSAAPVRREMGVKTIFNMLGPLVNPAQNTHQCVGVFNLELARLYTYLLQQSGRQFSILHALDGYDEISLTGAFKRITNKGEKVLTPEDLHLPKLQAEQIAGGEGIEDAAEIFRNILQGKGTEAQNAVVLANSTQAIQCFDFEKSYADCLSEAKDSLLGGKALETFEKLIKISQPLTSS